MSYNSLMGIASHSEDANILCWQLFQDTTGTTATDQTSNGNNGSISGMGANPTTTTGPNSYLTSAFAFDGSDDRVNVGSANMVTGSAARTYLMWVKTAASMVNNFFDFGSGATGNGNKLRVKRDASDVLVYNFNNHTTDSDEAAFADDVWVHVCVRVPSGATDTGDVEGVIDGTQVTMNTVAITPQTLNTDAGNDIVGGQLNTPSTYTYAQLAAAEFISFSRALSNTEVAEIYNGPEPENTVAPTVSGDTAQGSTLTCIPGTWALPSPFAGGSNGTITYTYQWTRDGGDISGATSSTYVTQEADVGTSVGCKVLGANDGGSDTAEQTASSNTISVVSATSTYRMNVRISLSNGISL